MGVEKARFRNPVIPDCKLELKIEALERRVKDLTLAIQLMAKSD